MRADPGERELRGRDAGFCREELELLDELEVLVEVLGMEIEISLWFSAQCK